MRSRIWLLVNAALFLAGCQSPEGPSALCLDNAIAGINMRVQDSASGVWAASGALLATRSIHGISETSFPSFRPDLDSLPLAAAWEQAGVFEVTVSKGGYRSWKATVEVTEDMCHVRPVHLTARLQRL
jgi:hypothetical protein